MVIDSTYEIGKNRKYDGYQRALASIVYKCFDKKTASGVTVSEKVADELHKPVIKKFKRRKNYARLKDNIWTLNLAEMGSLLF